MENISGGPVLDIMFPLIKDYYIVTSSIYGRTG
jgi:hypothetical protein